MLSDISFDDLLREVEQLPLADESVAPVAFFDADHTLWAGDLGDVVARAAMDQGLLKPEASEPVADILRRNGGSPTMDPIEDSRLILKRYFKDQVEEVDIISAQVVCYAGWTPSELHEFGQALFDEHLAHKIYDDMTALHEALKKTGIAIRVISGSPQWLVEAASARFDIPKEDVFGARAVIVDGKLSGTIEHPITYTDGKVDAMKHFIGDRKATIAFGDSKSDYPMQERCMIRVAVNPRPGVRKYAAENQPEHWRLWVPERTRDGEKVPRIDSDRVITE